MSNLPSGLSTEPVRMSPSTLNLNARAKSPLGVFIEPSQRPLRSEAKVSAAQNRISRAGSNARRSTGLSFGEPSGCPRVHHGVRGSRADVNLANPDGLVPVSAGQGL